MARIVRVIISNIIKKIDRPYDYLYPYEDDPIGRRVIVPFGKANAPRKALVLDCFEAQEEQTLKTVIDTLDKSAVITREQIPLITFLKEHYFISYYRALGSLLPAGLDYKVNKAYCYTGVLADEQYDKLVAFVKNKRKAVSIDSFPENLRPLIKAAVADGVLAEQVQGKRVLGDLADKMLTLAVSSQEAEQYLASLSTRFEGQRELIRLLLDHQNVAVKEALYMTGGTVSSVHTLEKKGIIRIFLQRRLRTPYADLAKATDQSTLKLNAQQKEVYESISATLNQGKCVHLVHGITGSGKTHIYMKLMDDVLSSGKSVLFMVPEISLTPQTLTRFYARYGEKVAVIHSGLSMGERLDEWNKIRSTDSSLVVGTRSAVFAPINHLGLIIMDEEHEASYKSESAPKYHARDIAKFLCVRQNIPLVLGSATPSLESYRNASIGRYTLHTLAGRYNSFPLPEVEMVDMREEYRKGNLTFLSDSLKEQLIETLEKKQQAIIFLNRRGAHTSVVCQKCGYVLKCPNCDISMTYHSANDRCICHFCSHSVKMYSTCPICGDRHIKMMGIGTQAVEKKLANMLPYAKILRMDMDTVNNYISYQTMLTDFAEGKYDILLGTQMVAKGLNLPGVTLVGVLQADMSLYVDDFRAGERTFSLLTQVCGRSGRADKPGKAVIQSYSPEHEVLRFAKEQNYISFYDYEIKFRQAINYPPYCDIALFTVSADLQQVASKAASALFKTLQAHAAGDASDIPLRLLRPVLPRIAKVGEKYRMQMVVKCRNSSKFRCLADICMEEIMNQYNVLISVDINPLSF